MAMKRQGYGGHSLEKWSVETRDRSKSVSGFLKQRTIDIPLANNSF